MMLRRPRSVPIALLFLAFALFGGCDSPNEGGSTAVGYNAGHYDPWYHGHDYYPPDVIVVPPDEPDSTPRPEHPIALPPRPTIPMTPRPMPRPMPRAGGRR